TATRRTSRPKPPRPCWSRPSFCARNGRRESDRTEEPMAATVSLPVLPSTGLWRLTPTDVTQFLRLERCQRFLRVRPAARAGQDFMDAYGVTPQRITPLLSLSGREFEEATEKALAGKFRTVHYAALAGGSHARPHNNAEVATQARGLKPGEAM